MIKKTMWIGLALSMLGIAATPGPLSAQPDASTVLTFDTPVEIPGQVLPAGTYAFTLLDSMVDRHVVQISTVEGSRILATLMTIPNYRLEKTAETVITYGNTPSGSPAAIRAWFHPNNTVGHEFVYPRTRALALAKLADGPVPATVAEIADTTAMKTAPIVTVTADGREAPVVATAETRQAEERERAATDPNRPATTPAVTTPVVTTQNRAAARSTDVTQPAPDTRTREELPRTASSLPLLVLLGLGSIAASFGLMLFNRRRVVV